MSDSTAMIGETGAYSFGVANDPRQFEQLKEDYAWSQQVGRDARQQAIALTEVVQRRAHIGYSDSADMLRGNSDLNEKLRDVLRRRKRASPRT
ncbi:hypothetical protein ACLK17_05810 [Escherichia coli]